MGRITNLILLGRDQKRCKYKNFQMNMSNMNDTKAPQGPQKLFTQLFSAHHQKLYQRQGLFCQLSFERPHSCLILSCGWICLMNFFFPMSSLVTISSPVIPERCGRKSWSLAEVASYSIWNHKSKKHFEARDFRDFNYNLFMIQRMSLLLFYIYVKIRI